MNPTTLHEAMRQAGVEPPAELIGDGAIHRFTVQGDKSNSKNGWYVLHEDINFSTGAFGTWKTDATHTWCNRTVKSMSTEERTAYRHRMAELKAIREAEEALVAEECREWCKRTWKKAPEASADHPYLTRKQIQPHGVKQFQGSLIIPVQNMAGVIHGMQFIAADGSKKFKTGTRPTGYFYPLGDGVHSTLVICEGFATGASIHESTGYDVAVAFSAGNLRAVANDFRAACPDKQIIIAADNDRFTANNPGLAKGTEAAKAIGASLVYPTFPEEQNDLIERPVDFNDLHVLQGLDAVAAVFREESSILVDIVDFHIRPPEYLIDGLIETPGTGMLVGATGSGKSFIVLDWALCVAYGKEWCGRTVKPGPVIYICGEGKHGIPRRVAAWHHQHGIQRERGRFHITRQSLELDEKGAKKLQRSIDTVAELYGVPPLIIIDTFARALPAGADENTVKDVQPWIHLVDRVRDQYNCTVIIVHHTGHADAAKGRGRGSSAMKAAMDFEILARIVDVEQKIGAIECTKAKDMEPWQPFQYSLRQVEVDDNVGSAVPHYEFGGDDTLPANESDVLAALVDAIVYDGVTATSTSVDAWKDRYYSGVADGWKNISARQKFSREKNRLIREKRVKIGDNVTESEVVLTDPEIIETVKFRIFRARLRKVTENDGQE